MTEETIFRVKDVEIRASKKGDRPCGVQLVDRDGEILDIETYGTEFVFRVLGRLGSSPVISKEALEKALELIKERCFE
jgi:hypothetical protein